MLRLLIGWQEAVSEIGFWSSEKFIFHHDLSSGNLLHNYGKPPFIVDLPIKNGDLPWFFVNVYQRVGGFNAGVMGPSGTWSDWWRPLRLGFRGFHYVFERQKEGRYMDHTFTCRCMLHVI